MRGALLALAALAASSATACGPAGASESTLEKVRTAGAIRVGYANEAPYAYVDGETGELTGEAPEIARVVLGRMGVREVEGVLTEFGSLIPGLKAGRFDVIAAGMYVTPARAEQIAFSEPTYGIGEAFVVAAHNPLDLHSYEELAVHESARLGVVAGTVELGYARAVGVPEDRIVVFPDAPSALEGVRTGRIDAYGGTSLTVRYLLERAGDERIERAEPFTDPVIEGKPARGYGAFGLRREDTALLEALNRELDEFIGSAEHLALVEPFGFAAEDMPGDVTTRELVRE